MNTPRRPAAARSVRACRSKCAGNPARPAAALKSRTIRPAALPACEKALRRRGTRPAGSWHRTGKRAPRSRRARAARACCRARSSSVRMRAADEARCGASVSASTSSTVDAGIAYGGMMRLQQPDDFLAGEQRAAGARRPARRPSTACAGSRGSEIRARRGTRLAPLRELDVGLVEHDERRVRASSRQTRSMAASSSRLPVGLFGEQRKTSLARRPAAMTASASRLEAVAQQRHLDARRRPGSARRPCRSRTSAGVMTTLSSPARQNARASRSIASSLPRPTSTWLRRHAVELRHALDERLRLRFGIAVEARARVVALRPPRHFVRVHALERRVPGRVLVRLQLHGCRAARGRARSALIGARSRRRSRRAAPARHWRARRAIPGARACARSGRAPPGPPA